MSTILIADDNQQLCNILKSAAIKEGYEVLIANDGQSALDIFNQNNPSMVLLDVMMPKLDGFQVCREIREVSNVPIIMITARGEDFEKIMGLEIGADDYIVKPFSPLEVMARVKAILRRIEKSDDEDGAQVVNDGDGGEQYFQTSRNAAAQQNQHPEGKGDVGGRRNRPAACSLCIVLVKGKVNQGGHDHAAYGGNRRQCGGFAAGQLALQQLVFDF